MKMEKKRYQVRANSEPKNPDFLGYPFAVIDTASEAQGLGAQIVMLANTRRSALAFAKEREAKAAKR
jgi:hypothetical protein